jgi:hypothetical protein
MKKPKHISDESWAILMKPDYVFQRFIFGFAEICDICSLNGANYSFRGTFNRKKDAMALATTNSQYKIHAYLNGKFKIGWSVIETVLIDNGNE